LIVFVVFAKPCWAIATKRRHAGTAIWTPGFKKRNREDIVVEAVPKSILDGKERKAPVA
jgi:hypothetical protein